MFRNIYAQACGLGVLVAAALPVQAQEAEDRGWFARAWGGYSILADTDGSIDNFGSAPTGDRIDVSTSGGFNAGAGLGYRYNPRLAVELAWEYRSNDSEVDLASGARYGDGNYASNTFFLNGYYYFDRRGAWEPYVGAGLAWIQEVDIDLEGNGPEQSFSGDGDVGLQVFAGTNYRFNDRWSAHGELRYGAVSGIDLEGENNDGRIRDFDYEPLTFQLGVNYHF
jgi:opacity protein-like surface antigen